MCKFQAVVDRIPCGHLFKNEQNVFVYNCSNCNQDFAISSELEEHILGHDIKDEIDTVDENNIRSNERYSTLSIPIHRLSIDLLKRETIIESNPFNLDECGFDKIQSDKSSAAPVSKPGPKSKTKTIPKSKEKTLKLMMKREKIFECDVCKKKFASYGFVKRHILNRHKNKNDWCRNIKPKRKKKDPVPCKICGKMLVAINLHMRTFHSTDRPFKCKECGLTYKYKSNLESHERLHTGDRPWMCEWCSRAFKRNSEMHAHINLVHKKVRKYKCDRTDCKKSYVNLQQLKDHINVHHLNLKNAYHCEICNRSMGTNKQYRQHMRDHLEKKHPCRYCEKIFPTDLGRKLHEFGSHSTDSQAVLV